MSNKPIWLAWSPALAHSLLLHPATMVSGPFAKGCLPSGNLPPVCTTSSSHMLTTDGSVASLHPQRDIYSVLFKNIFLPHPAGREPWTPFKEDSSATPVPPWAGGLVLRTSDLLRLILWPKILILHGENRWYSNEVLVPIFFEKQLDKIYKEP